MTTFEVEVFQNPYVPTGGTKVDAIVSVTAAGAQRPADPEGTVEVIVVDTSGSMEVGHRIFAAQVATVAAVDALRDGTWFAVVRGSSTANPVYPNVPTLVQASPKTREEAKRAVGRIRAKGGTRFSQWLHYTAALVGPMQGARCHAILLTDGIDEDEPGALDEALRACRGRFECDCRGIGADWQVQQLRQIAGELLGTVDIIPSPEHMEAELRSLMQRSMAKHASDVALHVWTPLGARVRFVKQVLPFVEDLTGRRQELDGQRGRYPLGSWGDETRSYHVWVDVPPQPAGERQRAARVELVVGGEAVAAGNVLAEWTDEPELSTRLNPVVAHYTGQADMADAIDRGVDALQVGDRALAERELGRAARLAAEAGNDDTLRLLAGVAEHLDPATGTLRLRPKVDALAERILEAESTKTVAIRRQP